MPVEAPDGTIIKIKRVPKYYGLKKCPTCGGALWQTTEDEGEYRYDFYCMKEGVWWSIKRR